MTLCVAAWKPAEKLSGKWTGRWSIRINDQWRIVFRWKEGAEDVAIVDYH